MQFSIALNPNSPHQRDHQNAIADGLKTLGIDPVLVNGRVNTKHVACWGWRQGEQLRAQGHEVLVIERGYLGDRFSWSSLAWNGLNGYGDFGYIPEDNGDRFNAHYELKPWRNTEGEYVLIMGQVPRDASLRGKNLMPWYEAVGVLAAEAYGLPVKFRPHPMTERKGIRQNPRHTVRCFEELDEAIAKAHVVITYNSNSAVDAVVRGVPAICMDKGAMAWDVTGHDVGDIVRPDRKVWASRLAWKQWKLSELADGSALANVLKGKI